MPFVEYEKLREEIKKLSDEIGSNVKAIHRDLNPELMADLRHAKRELGTALDWIRGI